jgi:5'-deoxynucleotidase YfbR-like HD superfamily hydrolase
MSADTIAIVSAHLFEGVHSMTAARHDINHREVCQLLIKLTDFSNLVRNTKRTIWIRGRDIRDPERVGEHCHQLERFAWFLNEHLKLDLDPLLLFRYAHIHDDVEYLEGDTPAFASEKDRAQLEQFKKTKEEREERAMAAIESAWGSLFSSYTTHLRAYEAQTDRESCFVKALDKLVAIFNDLDDGWRTAHILELTLAAHDEYKRPRVQCDPVIAKLYDVVFEIMKQTYDFRSRTPEVAP